ncbi:hypothetical protein JTE90_013594 [Oedothorax gibbosus]|uniref:Uncharacterized protein n=1 Tax=Oedothorax gibbosus TaxID=931172 RepID=A0AAV6VEU4_9ARAC|nr:hypothetical protein JTE90_013594 [Oedothorax gibbosus]
MVYISYYPCKTFDLKTVQRLVPKTKIPNRKQVVFQKELRSHASPQNVFPTRPAAVKRELGSITHAQKPTIPTFVDTRSMH